ncbi:MAG: GNAT family N-acetyltransferase [Acutalibacteraceae bacterium]
MKIVKNYRKNDTLRHSLNRLATETFGLSFESWYQNGFWNDKYIPYSMVENDEVIANVSANIIDILHNGQIRSFIQLGTVMTAETYRNKGLIRQIMNEIEQDFKDKTDRFFLFAGRDVLEFYPKFGFVKDREYQYSKAVNITQSQTVQPLSMNCMEKWKQLEKAIQTNQFHGQFDMINNSDLIMFYITNFMQDSVYYDRKNDAYIIAEIENGCLFIHNIFANTAVTLEEEIQAFGSDIKRVVLGFTPKETDGYTVNELKIEDTNLFVRGFNLDNQKVMFPTLSHA